MRVPKYFFCSLIIFLAGFLAAAFADAGNRQKGEPGMALNLTSSDFQPGSSIPKKNTCDDADVSPRLKWTDEPANTQAFALIMDDPDAPAGTWVHWVIYDLLPSTHELPEGVPKQDEVLGGAHQGRNDFKRTGYGGPCPPRGSTHRYFFKLYALNAKLGLKAGATKADVEKAMQGKIVAQGELMARFGH